MDSLGESYDDAVKRMVTAWNDEEDEGFGVSWQSGLMVDLANWPIEALSPMDCFHPSEKAHQRVAAGLWNRLSGSQVSSSYSTQGYPKLIGSLRRPRRASR
jgi:phospholipase B1